LFHLLQQYLRSQACLLEQLLVLLEQSSLSQQLQTQLQWLQQQQSQLHLTQQLQPNINTNKKPPANNRGLFGLDL
jgi:hypothetical protein